MTDTVRRMSLGDSALTGNPVAAITERRDWGGGKKGAWSQMVVGWQASGDAPRVDVSHDVRVVTTYFSLWAPSCFGGRAPEVGVRDGASQQRQMETGRCTLCVCERERAYHECLVRQPKCMCV